MASKEPSNVTSAGSTVSKSDYHNRKRSKINGQSAYLLSKLFKHASLATKDLRPLRYVLLILLQFSNNDLADQ